MDESTRRYREIRVLLEQLVATWPWDRPGTPFENAKVYLDFHCAECGAKLQLNDLAVVLELEMLRIGTVDARKVPNNDPICIRCYIRRAAPACRAVPDRVDSIVGIDARLLLDAGGTDDGTLSVPLGTTQALTHRDPTGPIEEYPALLESSPLLHTARPAVSRRPFRPQHVWWRRYTGVCLVVVGMLFIALMLGVALTSVQPGTHTFTLRRPTAPAVTTTAVPARPAGQSFIERTRRAQVVSHAA